MAGWPCTCAFCAASTAADNKVTHGGNMSSDGKIVTVVYPHNSGNYTTKK